MTEVTKQTLYRSRRGIYEHDLIPSDLLKPKPNGRERTIHPLKNQASNPTQTFYSNIRSFMNGN